MCITLNIVAVSIENQKVYGNLCIEIFTQQKSHIITSDILWDMGLPCSTFNNPKVYNIET